MDNHDKVRLNINTPMGKASLLVSKDTATLVQNDPSALKSLIDKIHFDDDDDATSARPATTASPATFTSTATAANPVPTTSTVSPTASTSSKINDADDDEYDDEIDDGQIEASGVWKRAATLLLISEYQIKSKRVEKGQLTKKAMWGEISHTLNNEGYSFSPDQVAGRWKTLIRAYKKVKDDKNKSGRGRKTFQYEDALDEVLGKDPAITPEVTLSSTSGRTNIDIHSSSDEESTKNVRVSATSDNALTDISKKDKKRRSNSAVSQVVETVQEMMRAQERRHEQRMEMFGALLKMQMNNVSSASSSKSAGKRRRERTPPSDSD